MSLHPLIHRVQTGVRMERCLVKVLKAVAELQDVSLGELLESITFNVFAGQLPFDAEGLVKVGELMAMVVYGLATAPLPASMPEGSRTWARGVSGSAKEGLCGVGGRR